MLTRESTGSLTLPVIPDVNAHSGQIRKKWIQKSTEVVSKEFIRSLTVIFIFFALLVAQFGCATIPVSPPPLSEEARAKLGTIGVVSAVFIPESNLFPFAKGHISGAAKGLAVGTTAGILVPLSIPTITPPIFIILVAASAITGAVGGIAAATPAEKVKEVETALTSALRELRIQETLRDRLFRIASDQTRYNFVLIDKHCPTNKDQVVNYSFLAGKEIDTILELSVLTIDFEGLRRKDPLLSFSVTVRVKLICLADSSMLYANEFRYKSPERKLSYWLQNDARLFMEQLERAYQSLSEKIVDELFLLYDLPLDPAPLIERIREKIR